MLQRHLCRDSPKDRTKATRRGRECVRRRPALRSISTPPRRCSGQATSARLRLRRYAGPRASSMLGVGADASHSVLTPAIECLQPKEPAWLAAVPVLAADRAAGSDRRPTRTGASTGAHSPWTAPLSQVRHVFKTGESEPRLGTAPCRRVATAAEVQRILGAALTESESSRQRMSALRTNRLWSRIGHRQRPGFCGAPHVPPENPPIWGNFWRWAGQDSNL
jgi:hypothetical protein